MKKNFNTIGLCGGYHAILYPEMCLENPGIDYVCTGDGEEVIKQVVMNLDNKINLEKISGICFKNGNGKIIRNQMLPLEKNLDEFPFINYDIFGEKIINEITESGWLRYISSRGCPYNCSYCHIKMIRGIYRKDIGVSASNLNFLRFRSIDSVIKELNSMIDKYDLKVINFMDDLFAIDRERTLEFADKFKTQIRNETGFSIQTHLEHMDEELVGILKDSRCFRVVVGLESATKRILRLFERPTSQAKMLPQLKILVDAKFKLGTWTLNIIANPTETKDEMIETLSFNAKCNVDRIKVNFLSPYPKSKIYNYCLDNDLILEDKIIREMKFGDRFITNLKFENKEMAFLEKFWDIGHWYMNSFLEENIKKHYTPLIEEIENIPYRDWKNHRKKYLNMDLSLKKELIKEKSTIYDFVFKGKTSGKVLGLVNGEIVSNEIFDLDWTETANEDYKENQIAANYAFN